MNRCALQRGFFVLRKCSKTAAERCVDCGRPMCAYHRTPNGSCTECCGRREAETWREEDAEFEAKMAQLTPRGRAIADRVGARPRRESEFEPHEPAAVAAQRHLMYTNQGYRPFMADAALAGAFYDDYDVRGFDSAAGGVDDGTVLGADDEGFLVDS